MAGLTLHSVLNHKEVEASDRAALDAIVKRSLTLNPMAIKTSRCLSHPVTGIRGSQTESKWRGPQAVLSMTRALFLWDISTRLLSDR